LKHGMVLEHFVDALAPQGILGCGFSRRCAPASPIQVQGPDSNKGSGFSETLANKRSNRKPTVRVQRSTQEGDHRYSCDEIDTHVMKWYISFNPMSPTTIR
jgi:hypothetical protein